MDIGIRLKMVRERYGLSQRELAKKAGVTNSSISLIEQNRVSPSVSSLKKLLESIPMSLGEFFTFDEEPEAAPRYIYRPQHQPDLGQNGLRLLLIGVGIQSRNMRMLRELYTPGADTGPELIQHELGEECGFVVRGTIELTIDGEAHVLHAGDGYYFPSTLPHRFRNLGADEAEIISANTPANF